MKRETVITIIILLAVAVVTDTVLIATKQRQLILARNEIVRLREERVEKLVEIPVIEEEKPEIVDDKVQIAQDFIKAFREVWSSDGKNRQNLTYAYEHCIGNADKSILAYWIGDNSRNSPHMRGEYELCEVEIDEVEVLTENEVKIVWFEKVFSLTHALKKTEEYEAVLTFCNFTCDADVFATNKSRYLICNINMKER